MLHPGRPGGVLRAFRECILLRRIARHRVWLLGRIGPNHDDRGDWDRPAVRDAVRAKYAAAAAAAASGATQCAPADDTGVFGASLYAETSEDDVPQAAVSTSLGCGVPTAVADLHEGETVLDLGSDAGADVLISARRVGPTGKAIGVGMTDEMLELACANAADAGVESVEFIKCYLDDMPLADATVDVIISPTA